MSDCVMCLHTQTRDDFFRIAEKIVSILEGKDFEDISTPVSVHVNGDEVSGKSIFIDAFAIFLFGEDACDNFQARFTHNDNIYAKDIIGDFQGKTIQIFFFDQHEINDPMLNYFHGKRDFPGILVVQNADSGDVDKSWDIRVWVYRIPGNSPDSWERQIRVELSEDFLRRHPDAAENLMELISEDEDCCQHVALALMGSEFVMGRS